MWIGPSTPDLRTWTLWVFGIDQFLILDVYAQNPKEALSASQERATAVGAVGAKQSEHSSSAPKGLTTSIPEGPENT